MSEDHHITVQPRCPNCDTEQYGYAVFSFSQGLTPCQNCGKKTTTMTRTQYRAALAARRAQRD